MTMKFQFSRATVAQKRCIQIHVRTVARFGRLEIPQGEAHRHSKTGLRKLARSKIINRKKFFMRRVVCLLGLVFLFSLSAAAQEKSSVIDIFSGYSFVHTQRGRF